MTYKVVPFEPSATGGQSATIADALDAMVKEWEAAGWEFVALENHSTVVPGDSGCFGLGASPPYPKSFSMVVFRK